MAKLTIKFKDDTIVNYDADIDSIEVEKESWFDADDELRESYRLSVEFSDECDLEKLRDLAPDDKVSVIADGSVHNYEDIASFAFGL